jgi:hypothetical protein
MDILTESSNLWQRFQHSAAFKRHVRERLRLVVPTLIVFVAFSVAVTAGSIITLGGTHSILVLVGLLTAPLVLLGTLFVQVFVFFSWLEDRALHPRGAQNVPQAMASLRKVIATFPPVMHAVGGAILFVPLYLLAVLSVKIALLALLLVLAVPVAYASLDR